MLVATLVATWYGDIFGVTQIAFERGIYMFLTQGVCWYVAYIAFALLLAKRLRRSQALSLGHLILTRFGPRSAMLVNVLSVVALLPVATALGAGAFIRVLTGLPLLPSMLVMLTLAGLCAHWAGFRGVVLSDAVQCVTMCLAVALVVLFSWIQHGGIAFLRLHLPNTHLQATGGGSWQAIGVWIWLAMAATFISPAFYQRCLAARDEKSAQHGVLIASLVWMLFDLCTLTGALYARAILPEADSLLGYLQYSLSLLPVGFRGFFLAGLLATILSTLRLFSFPRHRYRGRGARLAWSPRRSFLCYFGQCFFALPL